MNEKASLQLPPEVIDAIDAHIDSGIYGSPAAVVKAALGAVDRENDRFDRVIDGGIRIAHDDPRPGVPAEQVFERLERLHADRTKNDRG